MTRIAKLSIKNILGVSELEFEAGAYNEIRGRNGVGKTSILEAIKGALKGGHDATLLRAGETEGETVLVLDDGRTIAKKVRGDQSQVEVRDAKGKIQKRPASIVSALTDLISANPIDFLRAPAKVRAQVLLQAMPIEVDTEWLQDTASTSLEFTEGMHPLEYIKAIRSEVYDARHAARRAHREKTTTIVQLSSSLPDDDAEAAPVVDKDGLMAQYDALTATRDQEFKRIDTKLQGLRDEYEMKIQALRDELNEFQRRADLQRERVRSKFEQESSDLRRDMETVEERQRQAAKAARTRELIAGMQQEAKELETESEGYQSALDAIDAYQLQLLDQLPIPGLTVQGDEIYRDGVQFDRLNSGQQVEIAVEIAKLRAGELGVICVDGLELLDSERYEEFKARAVESGLQMFVSRVDDADFTIASE